MYDIISNMHKLVRLFIFVEGQDKFTGFSNLVNIFISR